MEPSLLEEPPHHQEPVPAAEIPQHPVNDEGVGFLSISSTLTKIGLGQPSPYNTISDHPNANLATDRFINDCHGDDWFHCQHCKARGPPEVVKQHKNTNECHDCHKSKRDHEGVRKFSAENGMDPFVNGYPHDLTKLTPIEEQLIAGTHTVFRVYRLSGGQVGYRGSVINLEKKTVEYFNSLPLRVEDLKLGDKEKEHGLSYVAFSRSTRFCDNGIIGGLSRERLTTKISQQQKLVKRRQEDQRLRGLAPTN